MAARVSTAPPRGMRDILPPEVALRDAATQPLLSVYRGFGFRRVETPVLESLKLLAGSEGGENEKLIFKVLKRGQDLEAALRGGGELAEHGLRFDLTVPLARYYAENHARLPDPLKAVQIGPVWRAERPQKGRFRQFTQCDIDVLGIASGLVEVELVLATSDAHGRGVEGFQAGGAQAVEGDPGHAGRQPGEQAGQARDVLALLQVLADALVSAGNTGGVVLALRGGWECAAGEGGGAATVLEEGEGLWWTGEHPAFTVEPNGGGGGAGGGGARLAVVLCDPAGDS